MRFSVMPLISLYMTIAQAQYFIDNLPQNPLPGQRERKIAIGWYNEIISSVSSR
jgi:hypothetical protein